MTFEYLVANMPAYMRQLSDCEAMSMNTPSERRALGHRLPAREGVYALYMERQIRISPGEKHEQL